MNESERRKSEISKYPGRHIIEQTSFNTNIKNQSRFDMSIPSDPWVDEYTSEDEGSKTVHQQKLNTFHFNVDLSNNEVKLRKELKRLHKETRSHMVSRENVSFKLPSSLNNTRKQLAKLNINKKKSGATWEIINELEETKASFQSKAYNLERNSKLMVDPRMLDPNIEDDYGSDNYQPAHVSVIDPALFPKIKARSYLRILELTKW